MAKMAIIISRKILNAYTRFSYYYYYSSPVLLSFMLLITLNWIHPSRSQLLFEAAFQGECRKSSPCQQFCFDLHDGTFECACHEGYHLDINGYSCLKFNHTNGPLKGLIPPLNEQIASKFVKVKANIASNEYAPLETFHDTIEQNSLDERSFYSCNEVECEAGGVCVEESGNEPRTVRCRCPLGRGGQFCEKIIEVKYPRFRGTSYLALPTLRNAHRSLQLSVEFKPETFDGVLMYSGQEPNLEGDFIAIVINQGFVELRFDCGMGEGVIRSDVPVLVNAWNILNIYRDGRNAWMQLNQGQQIFGHSKGLFSRITFRLETFLGGSPNISQIVKRVHTNNGLVGCVRALQINDRNYDFYRDPIDGIDIDQCNSDACNQVNCLNGGRCALTEEKQKFCICPLGYTGEYCEIETQFLIPSFNGTSNLQFVGFGAKAALFSEIFMVIKPSKPNGLFLYNGQKMDRTGDFISLNLVDGYVEFRFDLGSGAAVIRSPKKITIHEWHNIYAARTGREGILKVDDQQYAIGMSLGAFTQLSLPLNLYIGGVPSLRDIHQNVQSPEMFGGCIQKVTINGHQLSLNGDVLSGVNIQNCAHTCSEKPCHNNGICEPVKNHYQCHCLTNYIGAHCEQGTGLTSLNPMFYGNSFLKYTDPQIINRITGSKTIIHLNLRAFSSNGLILWLGDSSQRRLRDYFSIGVQGGHLSIDVNLGSGDYKLAFNATRIDDGQWHRLDIVREKKQILLRIDQSIAMRGVIDGSKSRLNANEALFLGGLEDISMQTHNLYEQGFIGCISNMTLDDTVYVDMVSQSERGINIRTCI